VTINPHADPDPMSYANTACPCGGRKRTETMLCNNCEQAFAATPDRQRMDDPTAPWESRRAAAIRILAAARRRCRKEAA
jgi:hypothetical protein